MTALIAASLVLLTHRPAVAAVADGLNPLIALCLASQPPTQPQTLWTSWSLAPEVVLPLLLALGLYGRGLAALRHRNGAAGMQPWQMACFAAGWLALVVALVSPLCRMAATLASAHMVQHVILVAIAPPLLILGAPVAVMRSSLPSRWRDALARWAGYRPVQTACRRLGTPLIAGALYGAAIWLWHVPRFYEAALLNESVHLLMYAVLIAVGLLFWRSLITTAWREPGGHGGAVISGLATTMHTGLLGALLTFAPTPWYPLLSARAGVWGMAPLEDQQLAGLIMWVPMGAIYLISSLGLMAAWLKAVERQDKWQLPG